MHGSLAAGDDVRMTFFEREATSGAVVEHHAGVARHHLTAESSREAGDQRDGVAFAVHGAEVGRVANVLRNQSGIDLILGPPHVDLAEALLGELLPQHLVERDVDEARVARIGQSIGEGQLLGFHHQMDGVGAVRTHGPHVGIGDDVELLQHDVPLGGDGGLVDSVATVIGR